MGELVSNTILDREVATQAGDQVDSYEERVLREWCGEELLGLNLAALAEQDGALAEAIGGVELGDSAQMVVAKDGSVSYRVRGEDGREKWLGYSSVPLIAAEANLKRTQVGAANMAMYRIGSGAEAAGVLGKMAGHQALMVVEADLLQWNLVFRLRDFSGALRGGRLVLLVGDEPVALFEAFYEGHPGYALVEQATTWTWLSERENQGFAQLVNQAMQLVTQKMSAKKEALLEEQKSWDRQVSREQLRHDWAHPESCVAVNCTDANTPAGYCASRDGLAGLGELGMRTDWLVFDKPEYGSQYAQLERLNRWKPQVILLVDRLRGDLSLRLPESAVCVSLLRQPGPAIMQPEKAIAGRMGRDDFVAAERREQIEQLKRAGYPAERLIHLPPGANAGLFKPVELREEDRARYEGDVVLVGHKYSLEPETYKIELPTHQQLFRAIVEEIRGAPEKYHREAAERILGRAQRCGIEVREDDVRKFFTDLIRGYLGDTVMGGVYGGALREEGFEVSRWYWSATPERAINEQGAEQGDKVIDYGEELNKLYNGGKLFLQVSGAGYADGYLLNGMAAGAFFLVKAHPRDKKRDGIGEMFELGQELITFDTPDDLVRKVRYYLSHDREREEVARAGRERVLSEHSVRIRARGMLDAMVDTLT